MALQPRINYIIDANINRFKEGARVLEDIARFVLQDEPLFAKIKKLKHSLKIESICRETNTDIGGPQFIENNIRANLIDITHANAIRMQEAARTLEELKNQAIYKKLRFEAYDIHHLIIEKLKKHLQHDKLMGIYAICNPLLHSFDKIEKIIVKNNIKICQLRIKNQNKLETLKLAQTLNAICKNYNCLLIINDYLDIALAYGDGVHLGQNDFPVEETRKIVPEHFIIGATCHSTEAALVAEQAGASYISVGCLYDSQTKTDTVATSLETLKSIIKVVSIPVCGIGGINQSNINFVLDTGVDMIAISQGVFNREKI